MLISPPHLFYIPDIPQLSKTKTIALFDQTEYVKSIRRGEGGSMTTTTYRLINQATVETARKAISATIRVLLSTSTNSAAVLQHRNCATETSVLCANRRPIYPVYVVLVSAQNLCGQCEQGFIGLGIRRIHACNTIDNITDVRPICHSGTGDCLYAT